MMGWSGEPGMVARRKRAEAADPFGGCPEADGNTGGWRWRAEE